MALFGKKKKKEEPASEPETKRESSTLDMIKEAMAEAREEQETQMAQETEAAIANQKAAETANANTGMPSAEEIRKAQEVLARVQANRQRSAASNAPINESNLKACIAQFVASKNQSNLKVVMDCLQNPNTLVTVPAQIVTSKENEEKMKQGGQVKLEGPVHINPIILTDNNGVKVFPIFSDEGAIPEDIKKKMPKVNMPFSNCLNIMKNIKDVNTLALDPYTANIRINVNIEPKKQPSEKK